MKHIIIFITLFSQTLIAQEPEFAQVDKINPFTGDEYQEVRIGEVYKTRNHLNRAITLYNTRQVQERLHNAPSIQEECHEHGDRFANWSYSRTIERTINAGLGFGLLGIDFATEGSLAKSFDFTVERWVIATLDVRAVHTPYMQYKVHEGVTYIQQVNTKNNKTYNKKIKKDKFYMDYIEPKIYVERKILGDCLML